MRGRALAFLVSAFVLISAPAALAKLPQQPEQSGEGGLNVCCGGTVGYVGGSGGVSGNVRGPSGGPGGSAPDVEPAPEPATSVLNDGEVADTEMPAAPVTRPVRNMSNASAVWPGVMAPTMVAIFSAGAVLLLFRRRPQLS